MRAERYKPESDLRQREKLLNGNGFYLGTSGSGKSFFAKKEIAWIILMGLADVIVMDPEANTGILLKPSEAR